MNKSRPFGHETYPAVHATFVTRRNAPSDGFLFFWLSDESDNTDWISTLRNSGLYGLRESQLYPAEARLILPAKDGRYKIETVQGRGLAMCDALEVLGTVSFANPTRRHRQTTCPSIVAWSYAAKFALELIARQCFVPAMKTNVHNLYAVWQAVLESSVDISRMRQLAAMMPVCAHALYSVPHNRLDRFNRTGMRRRKPTMMWHPEALLRAFLDASIDAFVRRVMSFPENMAQITAMRQALAAMPHSSPSMPLDALIKSLFDTDLTAIREQARNAAIQMTSQTQSDEDEEDDEEIQPLPENFEASYQQQLSRLMPMKEYVHTVDCELDSLPEWESRWVEGLVSDKAHSRLDYHLEDPNLVEAIQAWMAPLHENSTQNLDAKTGFWLEAPTAETNNLWFLRYVLVAVEDPTLAIPANIVFSIGTERLRIDQHSFENPQEQLLTDLGKAARYFEPLKASLEQSKPEGVLLDVKQAWTFISEASPLLISEGFDVRLPEQLTDQGSRRLRARFRIRDVQPGDSTHGMFGLGDLAGFQWEAALGDEVVSAEEFKQIVALKQPLVQWHGSWVLVDPVQLRDIESLIDRNETKGVLTRFDAMNRALTGIADPNTPNPNIEIVIEGKIADVLSKLTQEDIANVTMKAPPTFIGTLRPYQERGVAWLSYQQKLGLGCCLADDMGLGKTIQLICHVLNQIQRHPNDTRGTLLICPMSVVGNWKREFERFAPSVNVVIHHGQNRILTMESLRNQLSIPGSVVITTYGLMTRSPDFMFAHQWSLVVLDEAQAIKNASSKRSSVVRSLKADFRVALTGTPIENRLAELWSILDFLNPGLLGTHTKFQRLYAIPIERYNDNAAAERLRNLVSPFILRRVKTDPNIIQDLPEKMESKTYCTLTREQATLYQALVDETMKKIEHSEGIARQGKVLALLTHLKQIVDHPVLYEKNSMLSAERSGKVQRLVEMLETVMENGEKALIFTQFKEMGDVLVDILQNALSLDTIPFLHGGLSAAQRDEIVQDFQSPDGPPVFILSLRAGGTGLNLTAATHVFHFDRWWNPAVEDQATDRAYRIGQDKNVQVHKFLTMGTLEEKIDLMLEDKKSLSDTIVDSSGAWVTQLDTDALRELFTLGSEAMIDEAD